MLLKVTLNRTIHYKNTLYVSLQLLIRLNATHQFYALAMSNQA